MQDNWTQYCQGVSPRITPHQTLQALQLLPNKGVQRFLQQVFLQCKLKRNVCVCVCFISLSPIADEEAMRSKEEAAGNFCRGGGAGHGRPDERVVPATRPTNLSHRLRWVRVSDWRSFTLKYELLGCECPQSSLHHKNGKKAFLWIGLEGAAENNR